jgi:hypothetical protein
MRQQNGFALIQALIMSLILIVLASTVAVQTNSKVKIATALDDRLEAQLSVNNALNELLFLLLTNSYSELYGLEGFNFYGEQFGFNGTSIEIQDHAGLTYFSNRSKVESIEPVLTAIDVNEAARHGQKLIDVLTERANDGIQFVQSEQLLIQQGLSKEQSRSFMRLVSPYPLSILNPAQTPLKVLQAKFGEDVSEQIVGLRVENKSWSEYIDEFSLLTGIEEDEGVGYTVGPYFTIRISSRVRNSVYGLSLDLKIMRQNNQSTYNIMSMSSLNQANTTNNN